MEERDQIKKSFKRTGVVFLIISIFSGIGSAASIATLYFFAIIPLQIFTEIYLYIALIIGTIVGICGGHVYFHYFLKEMKKEYGFFADVLSRMELKGTYRIVVMGIYSVGQFILLPIIISMIPCIVNKNLNFKPIHWTALLYTLVLMVSLFITLTIKSFRSEKIVDSEISAEPSQGIT